MIRTQLWLTNYPQLGGHGLHIAHLLWGGLLMLIALGMLLSFLGRSVRRVGAVVGGIGFGFFIDELGKFVTEDNNYFFKPAAALIYVIFVALFLVTRTMQRRRGFSSREYLVNAMDLFTEAAQRELDEREKRRALALLGRADRDDPLVQPLRELIRRTDAIPAQEPPSTTRLALAVRARYLSLVQRRGLMRLIGWVFMVWAALSLVEILSLTFSMGSAVIEFDPGAVVEAVRNHTDDLSFINLCSIGSSLVAGALVIAGVMELRAGRRPEAFRLFDRALLIQIFITQVFAFVESQFSAVFGLGLDILLLVTVRYMSHGELQLVRRAQGVTAAGT